MWDLNYHSVLNKVENLLKQWAKRKLTLLGRVTIIKSLAISKFVHLLISLPNLSGEFINKQLEKLVYKYLWNTGPDRIKRVIIIKNIKACGLRIINIPYFIKALKVSWLRRVITNPHYFAWHSLSNINFKNVYSFGQWYAEHLKTFVYNPFWKDILQVWTLFSDKLNIENIAQVLDAPLWYNCNVNDGNFLI